MLAPQVKMASTIRSLVSVAETLRSGLQHRDPETDEILVDIKNTELYLKVRQSTRKSPMSTWLDFLPSSALYTGGVSDHECIQTEGK
jgi:hypothetical protein